MDLSVIVENCLKNSENFERFLQKAKTNEDFELILIAGGIQGSVFDCRNYPWVVKVVNLKVGGRLKMLQCNREIRAQKFIRNNPSVMKYVLIQEFWKEVFLGNDNKPSYFFFISKKYDFDGSRFLDLLSKKTLPQNEKEKQIYSLDSEIIVESIFSFLILCGECLSNITFQHNDVRLDNFLIFWDEKNCRISEVRICDLGMSSMKKPPEKIEEEEPRSPTDEGLGSMVFLNVMDIMSFQNIIKKFMEMKETRDCFNWVTWVDGGFGGFNIMPIKTIIENLKSSYKSFKKRHHKNNF